MISLSTGAPTHLFASTLAPDIEDAVGNKLSALYSRSYTRDYLDVDAIRSTGTISDARLIELLQERDAGFDVGFFTECLRGAHSISLTQVAAYGINASQLHTIQQRFHAWSDDIDNQCNE